MANRNNIAPKIDNELYWHSQLTAFELPKILPFLVLQWNHRYIDTIVEKQLKNSTSWKMLLPKMFVTDGRILFQFRTLLGN